MGRRQLCYLAYFWPFVKKILNSCRSRRQMDGWHLQIVFFWWRNWGTKWLFVFLDLLKPWNINFEIAVHTSVSSCVSQKGIAHGWDGKCEGLSGREASWRATLLCLLQMANWWCFPVCPSPQPPTCKWQLFASSCLIKPQTENASSLLAWHLWILSSFYN